MGDDPVDYTTVIARNDVGQITSIAGPHGRTEYRNYNPFGDLQSIVDETGYVYAEWDIGPDGRLYSETTEAGTTTYKYDGNDHTTIITDNEQIDAYYDKIGQLDYFEDDGGMNDLIYDGLGRTTQARYDDDELIVDYAYGPAGVEGDWTQISSASTGTIGRQFTPGGQLAGWTLANGGQVNYAYVNGRLDTETDPLGRVTKYEYDELGRVNKITDQSSDSYVEYVYYLDGRVKSTTNSLGETTSYTYPEEGVSTVTSPLRQSDGYYTQVEVDGLTTTTTEAVGHPNGIERITKVVTNAAGLPVEYINADGTKTVIGYRNSDVLGDAAQFPTFIRDESGRERKFEYYDDGRLKWATDLSGIDKVSLEYDGASGQLQTVTLPNGKTVTYGYDADGRTTSIIRDGLGTYQVIDSANDPDTDPDFNADGQPKTIELPSGEIVELTFDTAGDPSRVTNRTVTVGGTPTESATLNYIDDTDLIDNIVDDTGTTDYLYYDAANPHPGSADHFGKLREIVYPNDTVVRYQYDALGRVVKLTTLPDKDEPSTEYETNYQYDANGNLEKVWGPFDSQGNLGNPPPTPANPNPPNEAVTVYAYDELDRLSTRLLPNGVRTTWSFDERDRMESIVHVDTNDNDRVIASFTYDHPDNAVGEPHKITREDGSYVELDYDPALRLQEERYYANGGTWQETITYSYDSAGNRTSKRITSPSVDDIYTESIDETSGYQLAGIDGPGTGGDTTVSYGPGGRLDSIDRTSLSADFVYNSNGQPTMVDNNSGNDYTYVYDAQGRRTSAKVNTTVSSNYLIAPAAQRLGAGALDVEVQHLATDVNHNLQLGWVYAGENPILRFDANGNIEYYLEDASDSIAALVDANATTVAEYRYDGFGNNLDPLLYDDPASNAGGDFGFHAAWRDVATGLYDMRARTYDPETGRFLTPDPAELNPQFAESFNPYAFANGNPYLYSDPTGLFSITEINVAQSIQNSMQSVKQVTIQQVRSRLEDEIEEFAANLLIDSLENFLPSFGGVTKKALEAFEAKDLGYLFQSGVTERLCEYLPGDNYLWIEPGVRRDGIVDSSGLSCRNPFGDINIFDGVPHPDYIINPSNPGQDDASRTWLIGDMALSGNTLYKKYIAPGKQQGQWQAILNHATRKGIRIAMYFTFFEGSDATHRALSEKMRVDGYKQGTVIYVISLKK